MLRWFIKKKFIAVLKGLEFGDISVSFPDNSCHAFNGNKPGYSAELTLKKWSVITNLFLKGDVGFAEDYREGHCTSTDLTMLLQFSINNKAALDACYQANKVINLIFKMIQFFQRNTVRQSRKNISHHYDLGNNFYEMWLDKSMTYSSALFNHKDSTLHEAQMAKYQVILDRLSSKGNVLEIGCGWGGFAKKASEYGNYNINCLTLSTEQKNYAEEILGTNATVLLQDYRHHSGQYDHIVSIEMFEAVGKEYWEEYFLSIKRMLKPKGSALIQTITIKDSLFQRYEKSTDMLRTFIFPGGLLPSIKRLDPIIKSCGLTFTVLRSFGLDYAKTLSLWLNKFREISSSLISLGYDDKFQRLWCFYLAACIAGFTEEQTDVCQLEIRHAA
jgi:cyclopropane-fatty-acyl-phospholipid synthase